MKISTYLYYCLVIFVFVGILFSVRYVVNTNRIIVDTEESINPIEIFWEVNREDSLLRIKDPLYLNTNFYLIESQKEKYNDDTAIISELYNDSIPNQGSLVNLKPPFMLWKSGKNDTIKVFKNQKTLFFVKSS